LIFLVKKCKEKRHYCGGNYFAECGSAAYKKQFDGVHSSLKVNLVNMVITAVS
jgi:hypothetical protein